MLTLFIDTTFNNYGDASSSIRFEAIKTSLHHATRKYLMPVLGTSYATHLQSILDGSYTGTPSNEELQLIELLRTAIHPLTMHEYIPITDAIITDGGVRRGASDQMPSAFKYQTEAVTKAYLDRGYLALEDAIAYLINMAQNGQASIWQSDTTTNIGQKSLFVRSGSELALIASTLRYPHRMHTLIRSSLWDVQTLTLKPVLHSGVYTDLLTKHIAGTSMSPDEELLFSLIKKAQAHFAIANAIPSLSATLDEHGIHVLSNNSEPSSSVGKRTTAPPLHIDAIIASYRHLAQSYLDTAIALLSDTTNTLYPAFKSTITTTNDSPCINDSLNGVAVF